MKKMVFSVIAAMCVFGFTACGSDNSSSSAPSETTAQTEAAQQETLTEKTDEMTEAEQSDEEKTEPKKNEEQSQNASVNESKTADTVVVYFSATGTTKEVAERIANVTDADIFEITPAEPYDDADLDWHDDNSRTTIEMNDPDCRPEIANDTVQLEDYSTVYIGYPIWWGDAPRIMSTFVESHSFEGMTVIPFCTSGSRPIGKSGENLASQANGGNWLEGERLDASISESEIQDWISEMN